MERRRERAWAHRRRCASCGFDGRALQGDRGRLVFDCPACGADLYARPPVTYAQMEGLPPAPPGFARRCIVALCRLSGVLASTRPGPARQALPPSRHVVPEPGRRSSDVAG
ncbi:MAG: hypothetical protein H6810_01405 [Phycisphaeraceae bacterium]|nr:MAG: hypothetical protein H6810_01405 [Phycisphaeraceae bacterium]